MRLLLWSEKRGRSGARSLTQRRRNADRHCGLVAAGLGREFAATRPQLGAISAGWSAAPTALDSAGLDFSSPRNAGATGSRVAPSRSAGQAARGRRPASVHGSDVRTPRRPALRYRSGPSARPMDTPTRLADFEIIRRLGAGGMAEVFLAKRRGAEGTFKLLVVKRILPQHIESPRFRTMFAEEAQLATRLNHPNIVQVYDFQDYGEEGQLLSMEYVEGPDLRKVQRAAKAQQTRIPPYVAAFVIGEVAKGLHYAHVRKDERGAPLEIVHRDVSPQNILLSFEGSVKIADFGIATA